MSEDEKQEILEEDEEVVEGAESEEAETKVEKKSMEVPDDEESDLVDEEPYYENAVNKGDFIKVELTGVVAETGETFETTDEELAQKEGIWRENVRYGPRLVVIGEGWVLKGLDEKLPGLEVDMEKEIEISSIDAFGERNVDLVQMVPYRVLRSKGINPIVGAELDIDGRPAVIRSIGGGRVQVDYNHPLAGRNITYKVKIIEQLKDDKEKIMALISRRFLGIEPDKFGIRKLKTKIRIEIPDEIFYGENIQIAKRGLALDLLKYFEGPQIVEFVETIKRS